MADPRELVESSIPVRNTPPPAYSPPAMPSQAPPPPPPPLLPPSPPQEPAPVARPSSQGKNFSRPTLKVQTAVPPRTPSPPRRQQSMTPPIFHTPPRHQQRPVSHIPPPDGRPRDDIPYDSPASTMHAPVGYPTLSGQNRRTTMYFDSARSNRESVMSYDSRYEKTRAADKEKDRSCWKTFALCFACCCCAELIIL